MNSGSYLIIRKPCPREQGERPQCRRLQQESRQQRRAGNRFSAAQEKRRVWATATCPGLSPDEDLCRSSPANSPEPAALLMLSAARQQC